MAAVAASAAIVEARIRFPAASPRTTGCSNRPNSAAWSIRRAQRMAPSSVTRATEDAMHDLPLPRSVDELPYLFVWRLDDFLLPAVTTALGFVAGAPVLFGLGGFVLAWLYQRYRAGRPELFVVHWLFWLGLYPGRGRT